MIYIDEDLCTGCGTCVDACDRSAISIVDGGTATIDDAFCTSCGRCIDVCMNGAIISVETVPEAPLTRVPARSPQEQPFWAGTAPLSPAGPDAAAPAAASPAPAGSTPSRFELAERVLSGLLNFASFFLDRRQSRVAGRGITSASVGLPAGGNALGSRGAAGRPARRPGRGGGQGLAGTRRRGRARGRGGGRGSGRGRGDRCGGR